MKKVFLAALAACLAGGNVAADVFELNGKLSPGVNYGNVLEANPPEGWGQKVDLSDFQRMADAGFKSLRLPVRWNAKASTRPPYDIQPEFLKQVDSVVRAALKAKLYVVVDFHHYDELFEEPAAHEKRFLGIWKQVAEHFKGFPDAVLFEILNEPHGKMKAPLWNPLYKKALEMIRATNPTRAVIVSGADWGGAKNLNDLVLPKDKSNLIFTFHYYSPFQFTHQGAEWVGDKANSWLGTTFSRNGQAIRETRKEFDIAKKFSREHGVPIFVGEFGAYSKADMDSRVAWTAHVAKTCEQYGFSYAYWEFKAGFGLWDAEAGKWRARLRDAVLKGKP